MKREYEAPLCEIVSFETEDVIRTSTGGSGFWPWPWRPGDWDWAVQPIDG